MKCRANVHERAIGFGHPSFVKPHVQSHYKQCCVVALASSNQASPQEWDASSLDVSGTVVSTSYRSTPWAAEAEEAAQDRSTARVLFVSESGVCRALLAHAAFERMAKEAGLSDVVQSGCRATRNYCLGEGPFPSTAAVAEELGLALPEAYQAVQFNEELDIVKYDLVAVMDKFTAADVLREVSVYETVNKAGKYSLKVRRLGEFHPAMAAGPGISGDAQDIDDPLYGNVGGEEELEAVRQVAVLIQEACRGLVQHLLRLQAGPEGQGGLKGRLAASVAEMEATDWLVPPMLQPR